MKHLTWLALAAAVASSAVFAKQKEKMVNPKDPIAVIKTSMGTIECELYKNDAPKTVENFIGLSKKGFYDGILFHRVIKDFVIQAGDPLTKDKSKMARWGTGGESIYGHEFADELNSNTPSYKAGYEAGVLAMANHGPNTNSSQFFIMCGGALPHQYTIFGKVIEGMDVVTKIDEVPTVEGVDRPVKDVVIEKVVIK